MNIVGGSFEIMNVNVLHLNPQLYDGRRAENAGHCDRRLTKLKCGETCPVSSS